MPAITSDFVDRAREFAGDLHAFSGWARLIVIFCSVSVLTAVLVNFAAARRARAVRSEKPTFVRTGAMLGFFAGIYLLIRWRIGVWEIPSVYSPAAVLGLALLILGTAANIAGRFNLGRNWGNQVIIYQDHRLVTSGMYRIVRHPLYAGLIWMFIGASLVFQNWAAMAATLFIFVPAMYYRAKLEERALIAQFPAYAKYRDCAGMFVPLAMGPEVVQVPRAALRFCRISLTLLLWAAFWLRHPWLVGAVFVTLTVSVLLKVHRSPLVQLYQQTVLRLFPSAHFEFIDVPAMRFAHGMGAFMALTVLLIQLASPSAGAVALGIFCVVKTISAFGFCPASKLFVCMRKGGCCALNPAR